LLRIAPNWRGFVRAFCLYSPSIVSQGLFWRLCLCLAKSRFPETETWFARDRFEYGDAPHGGGTIQKNGTDVRGVCCRSITDWKNLVPGYDDQRALASACRRHWTRKWAKAWVRRRVRRSSPRSFETAGLLGFERRLRGRSIWCLRLAPDKTATAHLSNFTALLRFGNVRFWHKADITIVLNHVRFWGQSGHRADITKCPLDPKQTCRRGGRRDVPRSKTASNPRAREIMKASSLHDPLQVHRS
jgi:hypothetical protein